jgi:hypothetical protein
LLNQDRESRNRYVKNLFKQFLQQPVSNVQERKALPNYVLKIALAEHEKDELMRLVEDECNGALDFDEFYKWYQHFKPTVLFEEDDEEVNEDKDDPLTE